MSDFEQIYKDGVKTEKIIRFEQFCREIDGYDDNSYHKHSPAIMEEIQKEIREIPAIKEKKSRKTLKKGKK